MRKKIAIVALAGGLGLTGGMLLSPGFASAADSATTSTGVGGRLAAIKDALKGLVTEKTLTQAQADKVAETLDQKLPQRGPGHRGPGGPGPARLGPLEVAKVLGLTPAELRTQLEAGKTLAQIAQSKGISKSALIAGLVKEAEADLARAVTNGRLSQAQADTIKSTLTARITEKVDRVGPGPRGRHHHGPESDDDQAPADPSDTTVTPSSTAGASA
jgi:hypothetical protein